MAKGVGMIQHLPVIIMVIMIALGLIGIYELVCAGMWENVINAGVTFAGFVFTWWWSLNQRDE